MTKVSIGPDKATMITLAALLLHNMLRELLWKSYIPEGFLDEEIENGELVQGSWRDDCLTCSVLKDLATGHSNNRSSTHAESIREIFADHFWGPDQIPWQWKMI